MATQERITREATLRARNIGGIDETTVELEPGVTVLAGRNATNRTSLLQAFMAALGGEYASLKADADEGEAVLEIGDDVYRRTLRRSGGTTVMGGEPFLEDAELADLFAFLLESNPARRAVTTGDDLREIILRPVDTDEIEAEITRLTAEKDQIADELERLDSLSGDLPQLERERTDLEERIDEKRTALQEVKDAIERAESEIERRQDDQNELEAKLSELRERRSDLEDVRFDLETERESLSALREEREELEADREELPDLESLDREAIDEEIDRLQRQSQEIDGVVSQLQSIVQFNEEMLEGSHPEIRSLLAGEDGDDRGADAAAVTERLLEDEETVQCWTCGSEVRRGEIEDTIDRLRSFQEDKLAERDDLEERIRSLRSDRREIDETRRERDRIDDRLGDVSAEIERREARLEELTERRDELETEIDDLEAQAADLEAESEGSADDGDDGTSAEDDESLLELNRRANDLEFSLGRLERDLETTTERIEEIESALAKQERLEKRREEIRDELEELRTRIDRIEREAVDSFNEHMDAVLEVLEYDNIDRIWIERVGETVREGRRTVEQTAFDLHIVRSTDEGTYEDTIDHLSESEREVTGLIFALAGYLVHDVYEEMPFMLLDSLEAVDSNRIAALVEYFREYTDFLVVALLPEDANAIDDEHDRITEI
ncbi:archaea-specific SMC-related protein [Halobiforma nitratireducens]|uniref:Kinetochore-Ndc80 complex subunit Spc25 n=1 Tax=Halobiforma nitratireducens JCM 10879 TaxID=1227454 RepID=M0M7I6_9EURY|nr:archaea-specific SMC-related protein [Halobiforma nitratireducens]EMA41676.1 Kinetochore-Ndc80 complex subunit Spc25 [Halobiforma nitratireducens JCM 10879]